MIFQYGQQPVLIQRILIGFKAILERLIQWPVLVSLACITSFTKLSNSEEKYWHRHFSFKLLSGVATKYAQNNDYFNTWILHQIFMFNNKVKYAVNYFLQLLSDEQSDQLMHSMVWNLNEIKLSITQF